MLDMLSCVMVTSADQALRISDAVIKHPVPLAIEQLYQLAAWPEAGSS